VQELPDRAPVFPAYVREFPELVRELMKLVRQFLNLGRDRGRRLNRIPNEFVLQCVSARDLGSGRHLWESYITVEATRMYELQAWPLGESNCCVRNTCRRNRATFFHMVRVHAVPSFVRSVRGRTSPSPNYYININ
jgi:hypothetical protein